MGRRAAEKRDKSCTSDILKNVMADREVVAAEVGDRLRMFARARMVTCNDRMVDRVVGATASLELRVAGIMNINVLECQIVCPSNKETVIANGTIRSGAYSFQVVKENVVNRIVGKGILAHADEHVGHPARSGRVVDPYPVAAGGTGPALAVKSPVIRADGECRRKNSRACIRIVQTYRCPMVGNRRGLDGDGLGTIVWSIG